MFSLSAAAYTLLTHTHTLAHTELFIEEQSDTLGWSGWIRPCCQKGSESASLPNSVEGGGWGGRVFLNIAPWGERAYGSLLSCSSSSPISPQGATGVSLPLMTHSLFTKESHYREYFHPSSVKITVRYGQSFHSWEEICFFIIKYDLHWYYQAFGLV